VWKSDNSDTYIVNIIDEKWIVVSLDNTDYKKIENDLINGNFETKDLGEFEIEIYETTKRHQDEIELKNLEKRSFIKLNSKCFKYTRDVIKNEKMGDWILEKTKTDNIIIFFKEYLENSGRFLCIHILFLRLNFILLIRI
jgi:hypothetical protein